MEPLVIIVVILILAVLALKFLKEIYRAPWYVLVLGLFGIFFVTAAMLGH